MNTRLLVWQINAGKFFAGRFLRKPDKCFGVCIVHFFSPCIAFLSLLVSLHVQIVAKKRACQLWILQVTILEAKNRVGGRVFTVSKERATKNICHKNIFIFQIKGTFSWEFKAYYLRFVNLVISLCIVKYHSFVLNLTIPEELQKPLWCILTDAKAFGSRFNINW